MEKIAVWKPVEYEGIEYLKIREEQRSYEAESVVIGIDNPSTFRLDYHLHFALDYTVFSLYLNLGYPQNLYIKSDGHGRWTDNLDNPLPELDGCIDVDISATPFTNTLPIRRIQWQVGQSEVFKMAYIHVPDLTVSIDPQRYTCLAKTDQGATFRYESLDSDFKAEITVDSDGLVLKYPSLFERVV